MLTFKDDDVPGVLTSKNFALMNLLIGVRNGTVEWSNAEVMIRDSFSLEKKRLASFIHYPEHWDTAAYPTFESALEEIGCSECGK